MSWYKRNHGGVEQWIEMDPSDFDLTSYDLKGWVLTEETPPEDAVIIPVGE